MPFISVVVPVYNRENTITKTLLSIQTQTFTDFEVIIIDDGSRDKSKQKIAPFLTDHRFKYFYQQNSGKPSISRNYGIKMSVGEWISFLDSDDIWYRDKLEKQVALIREAQQKKVQLDLVFGDLKVRFEKTEIGKKRTFFEQYAVHKQLERSASYKLSNGEIYEQKRFLLELYKKGFILICAVMVKRKVLNQIGSFDDSLLYGEDTDLFLKVAESGICGSVEGILFEYIRHADNMTGSLNKRFFTDVMRVLKQHLKVCRDAGIDDHYLRERYYHYHLRCCLFLAEHETGDFALKNLVSIKPVYSFRNLKVSAKYAWGNFTSPLKPCLAKK